MKSFKFGWYKLFQALSLDVVTGAVIFSLAIGAYYNVHISWRILLCLSIATWIIYTLDHLLDTRKIKEKALTYRHQFHGKYKKQLFVVLLIVLIIGIVNIYYLPKNILIAGLIGTLFSLIYFLLLQKTSFWAKELYIAMVYTFGLFIGSVCVLYQHIQPVQWLLIPQVFLLVFSNLLLFSWFDFSNDKQSGYPSMVIHLGIQKTEKIITFILTTGVIVCIAIIFFNATNEATLVIQIILLLMYSLLILLFKKDKLFRKNDLYRVIGDGIFFIPLFFLLYAKFR